MAKHVKRTSFASRVLLWVAAQVARALPMAIFHLVVKPLLGM
jgi:hypothetical protein